MAKLAPANTILGQIERQVTDWRVALAMATAPSLEGGGASPLGAGGWGIGDNGNSYGAFQINLPFHTDISPGGRAADQAAALDPATAVAYMKRAYANAVSQVSATLWSTDPTRAAEQAAFIAERPKVDYYSSHGAAAVDAAVHTAQAALAGGPIAVGSPVAGTGATKRYHIPGFGDIDQAPFGSQYLPGGGHSLAGKLAADVRARAIAWLKQAAKIGLIPKPAIPKDWNALTDTQVRHLYWGTWNTYKGAPKSVLPPLVQKGLGAITNPIASAVASAITSVLGAIAAPIVHFFEQALVVVVGIVLLVIAIKIVSSDDTPTPPPAPDASRGHEAETPAAAAAEP